MALRAARSDQQIQQDVSGELRWDSRVGQAEIRVEVEAGVVTLTGTVDSHAKKLAARRAAHRVRGVLDVADDVEVRLPGSHERSDTEIAKAVRRAFDWDEFVPHGTIRSTVSGGWVTLEGTAPVLRQKEYAERIVRLLSGVKGVHNQLSVADTSADPGRLRRAIEEALERHAAREAKRIRVTVKDGTVVLEGPVRTLIEKNAVLGTVGHAPGVREVRDRLSIDPRA
jgi:osmotically-inducible protein OsmY